MDFAMFVVTSSPGRQEMLQLFKTEFSSTVFEVLNQSLGKEIRIKLVSGGKSKLFVQPTQPGRKHTVSFSWMCILPSMLDKPFSSGADRAEREQRYQKWVIQYSSKAKSYNVHEFFLHIGTVQ